MVLSPQEVRERQLGAPRQLKLHIAGRGWQESRPSGEHAYIHVVYQHQQGKQREVFAVAEGETAAQAQRRAELICKNCDGGEG